MSSEAHIPHTVIGRYAPSPTGALHFGNLRTALLCWLQARLAGGRLLMRMDDLDAPRNRPGSAEQILDDLSWLGLDHDGEVIVQSERSASYEQAFGRLRDQNRLFACRCSRKDIQQALSHPDPAAATSRYPGTCRPGGPNAVALQDQQDVPVAWRFNVSGKVIHFEDEVLGPQQDNLAIDPGDFVVRRKDGIFAYQLASVVDDITLGVTDVVRGADLLDSTARQIALFNALDAPPPRFWHVPLMTDSHGEKLSKRDGSMSLKIWREQGRTPAEVIGTLAASIGLVPADSELSAAELLQQLNSDQFKQALNQESDGG
ncbi:MAG: tRNA glutamyl-Q(34) synthetase GluQRS [Gammaproteobacteria bacterium]